MAGRRIKIEDPETGKTLSEKEPKRPSWENVYYGYPAIYDKSYLERVEKLLRNDVTSITMSVVPNQPTVEFLNTIFCLHRYTSESMDEDASAARVSIAITTSPMMKHLLDTGVGAPKAVVKNENTKNPLKGYNLIINVNELFNWLAKSSVWGNPEKFNNLKDIKAGLGKIKDKHGVCIISTGKEMEDENGNMRLDGGKSYATLWTNTDVIEKFDNIKHIFENNKFTIYFWELKKHDINCNNDSVLTQKDGEYSIDNKMIDAIKTVGWTWSKNCYDNAVEAVRQAYEVKYNSKDGFNNSYCGNECCISGNWDKDLINVRDRNDVTIDELAAMEQKQSNLKTNSVVNEFMLNYIKKCIDSEYPVVVGINKGTPSKELLPNEKFKLTNEGVTNHFLVLTSYKIQDGRVVSLHGFDNATTPPFRTIFTVNDEIKEMSRPSTDDIAHKHEITQVRMWKEVSPDNNNDTLKKHNWGSWGLDTWKKIIVMLILFLLTWFCDCTDQKYKLAEKKHNDAPQEEHIEKKSNEPMICLMSEKCVALLAYGLLSDDEYDIPFGGVCKNIVPDSVVEFLQTQKRLSKNPESNWKPNIAECIQQIEKKSNKNTSYMLSDCITLLAYGLLSNDVNDISLNNICKDIFQDTVVKYLQLQKHLFKRWQYGERFKQIHDSEFYSDWKTQSDINILSDLIYSHISVMDLDSKWFLNVQHTKETWGDDNLFVWRLFMLGYLRNGVLLRAFKLDTLMQIVSFDEIFSYLDTSFRFNHIYSVSDWCTKVEPFALKLKKSSNDDFSKKDFLLKYYDSRCQDKKF